MKMKKLTSVLLAIAMIPAVFTTKIGASTGFARTEKVLDPAGWTIKKVGMDGTETGYSTSYMEITDKYQMDGSKYALHVNCDMAYASGQYFQIESVNPVNLTAGDYVLKYWLNGELDTNDWDSTFKFIVDGKSIKNFNSVLTQGKTGWNEYTREFTIDADASNAYLRFITGSENEYIMDNIRIYKKDDESETNLIMDGDFECTVDVDDVSFIDFSDSWRADFYHLNQDIANIEGYETSKIVITDKYKRPGSEYCLYVKNDMEYAANRYLRLSNNKKVNLAAGEYVLEYWLRGTINYNYNWDTSFRFVSASGPTAGGNTLIETGVNGWKKYRTTYTVTSATTADEFQLRTGSKNEYWIDDITFYREDDANKNNIISDGDFEASIDIAASIVEFSDSWRVWESDLNSSVDGYDTSFMKLTTKNQRADSKYALHVKSDMEYGNGRYFCLESLNKYNLKAGAYTIKYWLNGELTHNTWDSTFKFISGGKSYGNANARDTNGASGWNEYTTTFNLSEDITDATFRFITGSKNEYIIDDIRVYQSDDDTQTNIISDGDFEASIASSQMDETVRHFIAYSKTGDGLNLAWINPNNQYIKNINIYNGTELLDGVEVNTAAGAYNEVVINNIENYHDNDIKIEVNYVYGKTSEAVTKFTAVYEYAEKEYKMNGKWDRYYNGLPATQDGITIFGEPTAVEKFDGNYSYHIVFPDAQTASKYVIPLEKGLNFPVGTYTVNYKLKAGMPVKQATRFFPGPAWADQWNMKNSKLPVSLGDGWYQYSVTGTLGSAESNFYLRADSYVNFFIDDIEVYDLENNLVYQQSFEDVIALNPKQEIYNFVATQIGTENSDEINVSWINPESYYIQQLDLYVGDRLVSADNISYENNATNRITVGGLTPNAKYEVKLVAKVKGTITEYTTTATPGNNKFAYSLAVVGDTAGIMNSARGKIYNTYSWLKKNVEKENIKFVFGLGDITNDDSAVEWAIAEANIQALDYVIPYSVIRGNKDSQDKFNQFFKLSDYAGRIAGSYDDTMLNSYQKFNVGNIKYLALNLDLNPSDAVIDWAEEVVSKNADHNVIVSTHAYLSKEGTPIEDNNLWDEIISKYENVVLVLSSYDGEGDIIVSQAEGVNGNKVTQMAVNPSKIDSTLGVHNLIAMLYFSEDGKTVDVIYYSATMDLYYGEAKQVVLDVKASSEIKPYSIRINGINAELTGGVATGKIVAGLYDNNDNLIAVKSYNASENISISFDSDLEGAYIMLTHIQ